jgi:DNA-binding MarR family transcriptional regulator
MPCRFAEWDQDLLREEMEAEAAAMKHMATKPEKRYAKPPKKLPDMNSLTQRVLALMRDGQQRTAREVAETVNVTVHQAASRLQRLSTNGLMKRLTPPHHRPAIYRHQGDVR